MILDALTRAEHERQIEKQPDLKFVTPVKPPNKKPNKLWLYVGLGVLANALVLFFLIRAFSGGAENEIEVAGVSAEIENTSVAADAQQQVSLPQVVTETPIQSQISRPSIGTSPSTGTSISIESAQDSIAEDRPLAMEANNLQSPEIDRPLFYESKQPNAKSSTPKPKQASAINKPVTSTMKSKGKVSFSSTELSADDALPVINKPKLLIDQGNQSNEINNNYASVKPSTSTSFVPNVRDLPESSRTSLNQYEVNVHVFDDNPTRSFVLINMDKYKEGDRIANNGPLVESITSEGVVVDYGSGRALIPAK